MAETRITIIDDIGDIFEGGSKCNVMMTTQVYNDSWDGTLGQCVACEWPEDFPKCVQFCHRLGEEERQKYIKEINLPLKKVYRIEDLPGKSLYNNKEE